MTCGHCLKEMTVGHASYNGVPVCNPEPGTGVMECYRLIRDFNHEFGCKPCQVMGGAGIKEFLVHDHG